MLPMPSSITRIPRAQLLQAAGRTSLEEGFNGVVHGDVTTQKPRLLRLSSER
jgi:hypothetical protein